LVVLGKNIGVESGPPEILRDNFSLSHESRFDALAAGELWHPGMEIIFSSGSTVPGLPSEAAAMKKYMQTHVNNRFGRPKVPEDAILLEEKSIDTAGNAEEVARLLKERTYRCIGLVSVGYHVNNAARLFKNYGVPINQKFASEEIVRQISPRHERIVENWKKTKRIKDEHRKEMLRTILLLTRIDRKGKLLRKITSRSRG